MNATRTNLGRCCVVGCTHRAVELAAPNVPYCARHAASNHDATRQYMQRMTDAACEAEGRRMEEAALVASAKIVGRGRVRLEGEADDWDIVIGTQYDPSIVALRSPAYAATSVGPVIFQGPRAPRYSAFAAAAIKM